MSKNQLFKIIPDSNILQELLEIFSLESLEDTTFFTKQSLKDSNAVENMEQLSVKLQAYYIPCKSRVYLENIDENKCITILRQFLKTQGYTLVTKDRSFKGQKMKIYRLIKITDPKKDKGKKTDNIMISFD
tara:strand:- start:371 stop:763 length:393 start_codon:yes stop_codon:yes gene_type:complete